MKIKLSLFVLVTGLIYCTPKHQEKPVVQERVVPEPDSAGRFHDPLTHAQLKEIERIHTAFSEVNSRSLDQTINYFRAHQNPSKEIADWLKMVDAYERFTLNKHIEEYDKKYEAYQLILRRSRMTEQDVIEKVEIIYLTEKEVKEILDYFIDPP